MSLKFYPQGVALGWYALAPLGLIKLRLTAYHCSALLVVPCW